MLSTKNILYTKTGSLAQIPSKSYPEEIGYDLWVVDKLEESPNTPKGIEYYTTRLKIIPPEGYYFELFARSSLHKRGYMLANNVGIIDPNYRGEIIFALYKYDLECSDLILPCRIGQLVPKVCSPQFDITELYNSHPNFTVKTDRDEGGFGSSNKH